MPRLIDADDLLMDNSWAFYDENGNRNDACIAVEEAPTADAVEVVRCKDCENWSTWNDPTKTQSNYCPILDYWTKGEFYCANGERREDGNNDRN